MPLLFGTLLWSGLLLVAVLAFVLLYEQPTLEGEYGEFCAEVSGALGAQRWALNSTVDGPPRDFPFEAIDECWFATVDDAIAAFDCPEMARLSGVLAEVCDMDRSITMLTRPTHRWPRTQVSA